jgi:uncharacterized protein YciI
MMLTLLGASPVRVSGVGRPETPNADYSAQMPIFLVTEHREGPAWDPALPLRKQSGFAEHAAFMDALVAEGVVVPGGPLADEHRVVLVVNAESEQAVREWFQQDPWMGSHLSIACIERWTILLDARRP